MATVASRLLEGEDYENAGRRAIKLLIACEKVLTTEKGRQWKEALEDAFSGRIKLAKALMEITGTDSETDGTKCYRELLRIALRRGTVREVLPGDLGHLLKTGSVRAVAKRGFMLLYERAVDDPAEIDQIIERELKERRRTGFSELEVYLFRLCYLLEFPRRRPKPRKKTIDGSRLPNKHRTQRNKARKRRN